MSGGFSVSVDQLRSHSKTVQGVASDVGTVAEAAATERAGGLVYGVLFDSIALPFLNMWADQMHGSIAAAERTGHAISTALAGNADSYETAEQTSTTQISSSGGR